MTFSQSIEYLYNKLPVFQNQGITALKNGLDGITQLCDLLDNPQNKFKSIHIAGTNGKGSTSHMLASVLQESGYKTGLYTSPHLLDFRERIRLNGKMIPKKYVVNFVKKVKPYIEANSYSFFEVSVALAFCYFADNEVDIAVIEVGLGGRLDSTNIITPELSIITNISDDHKNILGDTLVKIAREKAGIIKNNVPVIISTTQQDVKNVFVEKANLENAPIYFADQNYLVTSTNLSEKLRNIVIEKKREKDSYNFNLDLLGSYQINNIIGVVQAIEILQQNGYKITWEQVNLALRKVIVNTGLLGRWQILGKNPLVICDTGHNAAGVAEVVNNINAQVFENLHIVIGFAKDKDVVNILKLYPKKAKYYFCQANIPRAMDSFELMDLAIKSDLKGESLGSVENAFKTAQKRANSGDFIFVGGSTFVVADLLKIFPSKH